DALPIYGRAGAARQGRPPACGGLDDGTLPEGVATRGSRQFGEPANFGVEGEEVVTLAGQQAAKAGQQVGVGADRREMGIAERTLEPAVVAGEAAPGFTQAPVFGTHTLEGDGFRGQLVLRGFLTAVDRGESLAGLADQAEEVLAPTAALGPCRRRRRIAVDRLAMPQPALDAG